MDEEALTLLLGCVLCLVSSGVCVAWIFYCLGDFLQFVFLQTVCFGMKLDL